MIISASRRKHARCLKPPRWNHSTTCKPSLHSTFRSEDTLSPRHRQADVSKSCGPWWESWARRVSYNFPFLRDTSFTIIFPHFPFVLQPKNPFHKFWKNSPAYKTTHFLFSFDKRTVLIPSSHGSHRWKTVALRSFILDPLHAFLDDCWILIVLIHVVGVPNIDPHQATPTNHYRSTAASLPERIMVDKWSKWKQ